MIYSDTFILKWNFILNQQRAFRAKDCHKKYRHLVILISQNIWERQLIYVTVCAKTQHVHIQTEIQFTAPAYS